MAARFYVTTPIYYVNSAPHIGTAYTTVVADALARFHALRGARTHFLTGTDEHGLKIEREATKRGVSAQAFTDEMSLRFRDLCPKLGCRPDDFIRTTDARHEKRVQAWWKRCADNGDIYLGTYTGLYCVSCEEFKPEKDLVDGLCPIHKTKPEWIREKNWFFRLSKYQQALLDHYAAHPSFIEPETRRNEILRLVEGGLEDISMSRAGQSWGVPLPFDEQSVVYVWFDALINYAAAVGYGWDADRVARDWPASLHIVGKDITRFHCVFWPAMLMSAGLPLPGQVFGHGWVFFKGERMSKSLGNIVDPLDAARRFGPDPLRLYLTKEVPYGADGDFTWERFEEKYNADLANNLGNLVNRVASMADRYRQGRLDAAAPRTSTLAATAESSVAAYREAMERHGLHDAAAAVFRLISATNEFVATSQPWALAKDPDLLVVNGALAVDTTGATQPV
jgi:methionyl-tRNA synthetase